MCVCVPEYTMRCDFIVHSVSGEATGWSLIFSRCQKLSTAVTPHVTFNEFNTTHVSRFFSLHENNFPWIFQCDISMTGIVLRICNNRLSSIWLKRCHVEDGEWKYESSVVLPGLGLFVSCRVLVMSVGGDSELAVRWGMFVFVCKSRSVHVR